MSVNDVIYPYYDERREMWRLIRGRETFYDEERYLREWETKDEALAWARENFEEKYITEITNQTIRPKNNDKQLVLFNKERNE